MGAAHDSPSGANGSRRVRPRQRLHVLQPVRRGTYHAWRGEKYHAWRGEKSAGKYEDIAGFCKSATIEEIHKHGHVLTPGRYVGAQAQEDDGEPFDDKMKRLTATLREQQAEAATLDAVRQGTVAG